MSKPQALQLTPQTELTFDGPFTEVVTTYLTLGNPSNQTIYFKVKTTAPRYYCVRPNSGVIQPNGSTKISVMLQPVDQPSTLDKDRTRHKFMIQAAFAKSDEISVDEFWKSVDSSEIMDSKLKVVFNNLNLNGGDAQSGQRSPEGSVYHDEVAQSHQQQPVQRRNVQSTGNENRRSSPSESDGSGQKERVRLEDENRSLTMQVQELRHKLNTFSNTLTQNEGGIPLVQVILLALAALLIGIILGKLF